MSELKYFEFTKPGTCSDMEVRHSNEFIKGGNGYFNISYEFYNGLTRTATVALRNGLLVEIPPKNDRNVNDFVVRVRITMGRDVKLNTQYLLCSESLETKILNEAIANGASKTTFQNTIYSLDYHLTLQDLESNGGSLYLHDLDFLVSILNGGVPAHPHSDYAVLNNNVAESEDVNSIDRFSYNIKISDPNHRYGPRFTTIHRKVYRIPVMKNSELPEGVYFVSDGPANGNHTLNKPVSLHFTFEEADKELMLFTTYDEAKNYGDEVKGAEKELAEIKFKLKETELQLKEADLEGKREEAELKRALGKAQHEKDMLQYKLDMNKRSYEFELERLKMIQKAELEDRKHQQEERTLKQKKGLDDLIWVKGLIVAGIGLATVLGKLYVDNKTK